jgi:hypothetical protein
MSRHHHADCKSVDATYERRRADRRPARFELTRLLRSVLTRIGRLRCRRATPRCEPPPGASNVLRPELSRSCHHNWCATARDALGHSDTITAGQRGSRRTVGSHGTCRCGLKIRPVWVRVPVGAQYPPWWTRLTVPCYVPKPISVSPIVINSTETARRGYCHAPGARASDLRKRVNRSSARAGSCASRTRRHSPGSPLPEDPGPCGYR